MIMLYVLKLLSSLFPSKKYKKLPYKSTTVGNSGYLFADPSEISEDMRRRGLYEKAERLVKEKL